MVKVAKDAEAVKSAEAAEHDLEPRKLEYSPSRKPRLAPDPADRGDGGRVESMALMAFCFVGLQVSHRPPHRPTPPAFLPPLLCYHALFRLCNPPPTAPLALCPLHPVPCTLRAYAAACRAGLVPHVGLLAGEGDDDRVHHRPLPIGHLLCLLQPRLCHRRRPHRDAPAAR